MKGFIEVTYGVSNMVINIHHIISFGNNWILLIGHEYETRIIESYEEIKKLISEAL